MRTTIASGDPFEAVYGYSRAVRAGNQIHVSGTTAQAPFVDGCDTYVQMKNALEIVTKALSEAGSSLKDVVRTVTYLTDINDAPLAAKAHLEFFDTVRPAATLIEVSALDDPARTVEVEVYAVTDEDSSPTN